jgi:predicted nucleic acid-binding protein
LPIGRHGMDLLLPRIWQLRRNLTAYDAAYVALGEALQCPLLTLDERIARAPGLQLEVRAP